MAQINLTESQIRELFAKYSGQKDFSTIIKSLDDLNTLNLDPSRKYVVKSDVLISGRFKKGLIKVNISLDEAKNFIKENFGKVTKTFIIQPFLENNQEYYFSIETMNSYDLVRFSDKGGIEIENNWDTVKEFQIPVLEKFDLIKDKLPHAEKLEVFYKFFIDSGFAFLEVNPFIFNSDETITAIDFKGRVDNCFKDNYKFEVNDGQNESEKIIKELDLNTGASLKFKLLNPDAKVWPMIAGGGASIVYFDLIAERFGIDNVGFYGEYSGNPTAELTFAYSDEVIKCALQSTAKDKVLVIAGGNANFTDIPKTFDGIIQGLEKHITEIQKDGMKVIVRRAGPNDKIGLKRMKDFLDKNNIPNEVYGIEKDMYAVFN